MRRANPEDLAADWPARERQWARELGRIRIGVEPITDQVAKYRRVTWLLMAVAAGIGLFLLALFTAFRSPGTGLIVAGVIVGPIIVSAWFGQIRLAKKAARYLREKAEVERLRESG